MCRDRIDLWGTCLVQWLDAPWDICIPYVSVWLKSWLYDQFQPPNNVYLGRQQMMAPELSPCNHMEDLD